MIVERHLVGGVEVEGVKTINPGGGVFVTARSARSFPLCIGATGQYRISQWCFKRVKQRKRRLLVGEPPGASCNIVKLRGVPKAVCYQAGNERRLWPG
jgi:hypothetical protein